jgi:hypothetical protein
MAKVKKLHEDIALELIKSILSSKQRTFILETAIEMFDSTNKGVARMLSEVNNDMAAGMDSISAFHNNNFLREDTYNLLKMLQAKGALGLVIIDIMLKNNKKENEIAAKKRSLFIGPLFTLFVGIFIGNYLVITSVGVVRDNPQFNLQINDLYYLIADNFLIASILTATSLGILVWFGLDFIMKRTGGIYMYLYKANTMIFFLRKAKVPYSEIFQKVQILLPRGTRARSIMENIADEIKVKKIGNVIKDFLKLYPLSIMSTKMTQFERGEEVDAFYELSVDSSKLYDEYAAKLSSSLPTMFLVLTFGYMGWCLAPLGAFLGEVMGGIQ